WTRLNADQAWWQHREKLQYLGAGHTLADNNRAITRYAVNLEYRLRNIETDRANLAHGRLPSLWFALSATTLGTIDAVEWAPSTASLAGMPGLLSHVRFALQSGHKSGHR